MAEDRMTLRLPAEVKRSVEAAADREGVKPGTWARRALEAALGSSSDANDPSGMPAGRRAPVASASPRASEPPPEAVEAFEDFKRDLTENGGIYACRMPHCDFKARSPSAVCGVHGRKVVPVVLPEPE